MEFDKIKIFKAMVYEQQAQAKEVQYYRSMLASGVEAPPLTAQMFEDAKAHIAEHGWVKGAVIDTLGVCAQGAFGLWKLKIIQTTLPDGEVLSGRVAECDNERHLIFRVRMAEIMDLMGLDFNRYRSVMNWNDQPERTQQEVEDALMLAAKKLRDQGR